MLGLAKEGSSVAANVLKNLDVTQDTFRHGRHRFISHALAGGRTLAEVRDAAGHANVRITRHA